MTTPNDTAKVPFEETEAYQIEHARYEQFVIELESAAGREPNNPYSQQKYRWNLEDAATEHQRRIEDLRREYDMGGAK